MRRIKTNRRLISIFAICSLAALAASPAAAGTCSGKSDAGWPTSRIAEKWPFAADSVWNIPIGCNAKYVDAKLAEPDVVSVDTDLLIVGEPSDPKVPVYWAGGIHGNTSTYVYGNKTNRCRGRVPLQRDKGSDPIYVHVPYDLVIPSIGANHAAAVLNGDEIRQMNAAARCEKGGPLYGTIAAFSFCSESIRGSGIKCPGGHGGSLLSSIGGTLRKEDFMNDEPIRHALKINLRPYQFYLDRSKKKCDYRWPARNCDNHLSKYRPASRANMPSSNVKAMKYGALLALPPNLTPAKLGIKSKPGLKLFDVLQDYGVYPASASGIGPEIRNSFEATYDAEDQFEKQYGYPFLFRNQNNQYNKFNPRPGTKQYNWMQDVKKLVSNLHVVDDNSRLNPGGSGSQRRRPMAPSFSKGGSQSSYASSTDDNVVAPKAPRLISVDTD